METIFFNFIWGSKIDKIKRNVLKSDYTDGGLKMIDIFNFITALKCSWVRRLIKADTPWVNMFKSYYGKKCIERITDFGDDYIDVLLSKTTNQFWKDVLTSWKTFVKCERSTKMNNILCIPLWYNSSITIGEKSIFYQTWYRKGIKIIGDIVDNNGVALKKEELEDKFCLDSICILRYNGLCNSVKKAILNYGMNVAPIIYPYIDHLVHMLYINPKGCNVFYRQLPLKKSSLPSEQKWANDLNLDHVEWRNIYNICFKMTTDTTLQWFQYRILTRILPVNDYLFKIGYNDTRYCSLCGEDLETLVHLFYNCEKSKDLWNLLCLWIKNKTHVNVELNVQDIIFGVENSILNFIIMVSKYYIYTSAKKGRSIHIFALQKYIEERYRIEKFIACKNMKSLNFNRKWYIWEKLFTE